MKIAVIGTSGQLGFDLHRLLPGAGHDVIPFSGRAELDITDPIAIHQTLERVKPDALINTAAFHNVDLCEKESDAALRTNVTAVRDLAKSCESRGITFIQIGTDYVTEGHPHNTPIPESCARSPHLHLRPHALWWRLHDPHPRPHLRLRRALCGLFGVAGCKLKGGLNFIDTMIKAAREGGPEKPLRVVDDQIVAPTPTDDLARQLAAILNAGKTKCPPGLYHAVSHGETSWYNFAKTALELANVPHVIHPVASSVYAAPAKRPRYSVLDNAKLRALNLDLMRPRESLARYLQQKYS